MKRLKLMAIAFVITALTIACITLYISGKAPSFWASMKTPIPGTLDTIKIKPTHKAPGTTTKKLEFV